MLFTYVPIVPLLHHFLALQLYCYCLKVPPSKCVIAVIVQPTLSMIITIATRIETLPSSSHVKRS